MIFPSSLNEQNDAGAEKRLINLNYDLLVPYKVPDVCIDNYLTTNDNGFAGLRSDGAIIIWGLNAEVQGSMTATELKNARNFVDVKVGDYYGVFVGIKSDGSVALFGSSIRNDWYRGNNSYSSWNANYKEGHVHLPGTIRTPDIQITSSIKKLTETTVVEKNKYINQ